MTNILENSICYLAGPIDYAKDQGKGWRKEVKKKLKSYKIHFLDPTNKLKGLTKEVDSEQEKIKTLKVQKKWEELSKMMKNVVRSDLRCIDVSDYIIAYVDPKVQVCGTYHEMINAINQKKPVLIVVNGGKEKASSWLFGICDYKNMFDSFDELFAYLEKIHKGKIKLNNRWVLIRKQLQDKELED